MKTNKARYQQGSIMRVKRAKVFGIAAYCWNCRLVRHCDPCPTNLDLRRPQGQRPAKAVGVGGRLAARLAEIAGGPSTQKACSNGTRLFCTAAMAKKGSIGREYREHRLPRRRPAGIEQYAQLASGVSEQVIFLSGGKKRASSLMIGRLPMPHWLLRAHVLSSGWSRGLSSSKYLRQNCIGLMVRGSIAFWHPLPVESGDRQAHISVSMSQKAHFKAEMVRHTYLSSSGGAAIAFK